jgi:hypothetical protein
MVVDEKTYKDLIYKIASEDSGFKKVLDERIDLYKKNTFEIEQLKNRAYKFCNIAHDVFKFNVNTVEPLSQDEFIQIVMDKFDKMVSQTVGNAVMRNSPLYKDKAVFDTLKSFISRFYDAGLEELYHDTLKYCRLVFHEVLPDIYSKCKDYEEFINMKARP